MRKLCLTPVIVADGFWLAAAAGAIATGRRRNVEAIEIAPSEPALVA